MRVPTSHRRAYSLAEMSTVVAIIGTIAAMAAPRYANSRALYRAQAAAQRIAADLALAQRQAKVSSLGQSIAFNFTTNSYTLAGLNGLTGQPSPYGLVLSNDPYDSTIVSNSASTLTITYDRFGQPSAGATITVQVGSTSKNVVIDPNTGLATVQ